MADLDYLKRNVFPGESGGDYNALFGYSNRPGGQFGGVRLTDMTVADALAFSDPSGPYGQWVKGQVGRVATPMGAYQVVGSTLRAAKEGLGLTGNERMTPELQDAIGMWIYQNQGPGAWEGWGGGGGNVTASTKGAPMGLLNYEDEQRPQTFMERLGIQRRDPAAGGQTALPFYQRDNFTDALGGIGAMLMGMDITTRDMAPAALAQVERRKDKRSQKESVNRTAAWLEANGRPDLAEAVRGGVIDGASAFTVMNQKDERGQVVSDAQLRELYPGAQIEPGLYNLKSDGTITKVGGGGTTINMPDQIGTIPPGYKVDYDANGRPISMSPIPGGPAAAEAEKAASGAAANAESKTITADIVLDEINAIKGKVGDGGLPTTGMFGGLLSNIGGTDAGDISASLDTIKGNIAFDKLQAMKEASPTGGALGSVTENELRLLQSTLGSLEQSQSEEQFLRNLTRLEAIYGQIMQKARAYPNAAEFGFASSGAPGAGTALSPEAQRYLEGN